MNTNRETRRKIFERIKNYEISPEEGAKLLKKAQAEQSVEQVSQTPFQIAIIGMAGRFPGAMDVGQFWNNLAAGKDCIREIPADRWDKNRFYDPDITAPDKSVSRWGGFLDEIACFDPRFFMMSPLEAELTDPRQRLFLQEAWNALEDAGYSNTRVNEKKCGVFVGCLGGDYTTRLREANLLSKTYAELGNENSILAARISYFLNLKGPSIAIDTACSSSLVAIHLACESLRWGTSELAIAGGIMLMTTPGFYLSTSKAGMLSPQGRCKTFDNDADGFVPGEGVGVVVLKPLQAALADRDHIYGIIRGSGINQDGKTNGITAPSASAQTTLECEVYEQYHIHPESITYVEAHGTATKLGDPIEVDALTDTFRRYTSKKQYCGIGSVKSNIGHSSAAAGISGLIKVLLCLKHKKLVPSLHFTKENQHIHFSNTPFYVNTVLKDWDTDSYPRRAAISSFGFSGTNAHLVIEEPPAETIAGHPLPDSQQTPSHLIVLSAKTEAALSQKLQELRSWLEREAENHAIGDVAHTLLIGRSHFPFRCALLVADIQDLKHTLDEVFENGKPENYLAHQTQKVQIEPALQAFGNQLIDELGFQPSLTKDQYNAKLHSLADLYTKGYDLDWESFYRSKNYSYISLPTYPFAKERHWVSPLSHEPEVSMTHPEPLESARFFFIPQWVHSSLSQEPTNLIEKPQHIVIIHPLQDLGLVEALEKFHQKDTVIKIRLQAKNRQYSATHWGIKTDDPFALDRCLQSFKTLDKIYFLGGIQADPRALDDLKALTRSQEQGVRSLFRLIKSLITRDLLSSALRLTVITSNVHEVLPGEHFTPHAASIFGLTKSLAKEYPHLEVSCLDISSKDRWNSPEAITPILIEPANPKGDEVAIREGKRYIRTLIPVDLPAVHETPFKLGGVYLIVGGAGGIGLALSHYLAETVQAKLVLVGRSRLTPEKQHKISEIEARGGKVLYLQADASDIASLQEAAAEAKARFGGINGVIHSAIVLHDKTLRNMDEEIFQAVLKPKVEGSVVLSRVFQKEPLDFMLFFSSAQSFSGNPGQSNYAAGCTFKDAFALALNQRNTYPVKAINWGYWGDVGIVSTEDYQKRLTDQGLESISQREGMEAVQRIVGNRVSQIMAIKANEEVLDLVGVDFGKEMKFYPERLPALLPQCWDQLRALPPFNTPLFREIGSLSHYQQAYDELERLGRIALLDMFQRLGIFRHSMEQYTRTRLKEQLRIIAEHHQLYDCLLDMLCDAGFIHIDGEKITTSSNIEDPALQHELHNLESRKNYLFTTYSEIRPHLNLLWTCLSNFAAILQGKISAPGVIFPGSSNELVENLYAGNPVSDYFNHIVALTAQFYIKARIEGLNPGETIKILEVGAGTGGTSASVFKVLREYGEKLHYVYTDISLAFVRYGERQYGLDYPFTAFKVLNIEDDPEKQGYALDDFDVVIATNVLHATRSIKDSLSHIKALLKTNGWIILNEATSVRTFSTLTFGLLKGWWLFEDDLRLKGSPLIRLEIWERALKELGFEEVVCVGPSNDEDNPSGQHIIVGESNGAVLCQTSREKEVAEEQECQGIVRDFQPVSGTPAPPVEQDPRPSVEDVSMESLPEKTDDYVKTVLSRVLKIKKATIDSQATFEEYGVDSLVIMPINREFEKDFGKMPTTLLYEHMTVEQLTDYFLANHQDILIKMFQPASAAAPSETSPEKIAKPPIGEVTAFAHQGDSSDFSRAENPSAAITDLPGKLLSPIQRTLCTDIAIIGLSGRYPLAETVDEFWERLKKGENCIREIPKDRWDWQEYFDPDPAARRMYTRWGGFIKDPDKFDPLFFNISPREAEQMDPQERLFLQTAWAVLEDAGYTRKALKRINNNVGVFVGAMNIDYEIIAGEIWERGGARGSNSSYWTCANRVSYYFNFHGPSFAVDTACSSSLTALHLACESLKRGECQAAIVGGVNLILHPLHFIRLCEGSMLAKDDRCKSFGNSADGFVDGEGIGAILLKPFEQAVADRDHIYGVIKGTSINAGGKTSGYTVPNPNAQADLVVQALKTANINPRTISYVDAHGTGTALGDPIEITGLTKAFRQYTDDTQFCSIGSVKSNIGHLESGAAIASLTKVLLQMKHQQLTPSLHSSDLNPGIDFEQSPFSVQQNLAFWEQPVIQENGQAKRYPRRAGISSFGAGGANAHVILEEYEASSLSEPQRFTTFPQIFVLSAKNQERLKEYAHNMAMYVETHEECLSIRDVVYTLQVAREPMPERLAVVSKDLQAFKEKLRQYTQGKTKIDNLYTGNVKQEKSRVRDIIEGKAGKEIFRMLLQEQHYSKLAQLWVAGVEIDWQLLHQDTNENSAPPLPPQRISLPTYPFAREWYWLEISDNRLRSKRIESQKTAKLHPLLDSNTSTLREQKFTSRFTGEEFYLADHVIADKRILPAVAYIEMARKAGELAGERPVQKLKNIIWAEPVIVEDAQQVTISVSPIQDMLEYQVRSGQEESKRVHSQGKILFGENQDLPPECRVIDIEAIKRRCSGIKTGEECYMLFQTAQLKYGRSFQGIKKIFYNNIEALSLLELPPHLDQSAKEFTLHPAIMDAALQTWAGLSYQDAQDQTGIPFIPFGVEEVNIVAAPFPQKCYAYVKSATPQQEHATFKKFDLVIADETGRTLVSMKNVSLRPLRQISPVTELLYYETLWEKSALSDQEIGELSGTLLIFDVGEELWKTFNDLEEVDSSRCILVKPAENYQNSDERVYTIDPEKPDDYRSLIAALARDNLMPNKIVCLWPIDTSSGRSWIDGDSALPPGISALFFLTKALIEQNPRLKIRLLFITPGTAALGQPDQEEAICYAANTAVSGFAKTVRLENSRFFYSTVAIERASLSETRLAEIILQEFQRDDESIEIRYDNQERSVKRFQEVCFPREPEKFLLKDQGIFLITGGAGGLGLIVAEYLAKEVKATLILTGRSELTAEKKANIHKLEALGSKVVYIKSNVAKQEDVEELIATIKARFGKINGIIHSAGVIRDALITNKTRQQFEEVLAPKVHGTIYLDQATRKEQLDFFVLFSSMATAAGNVGQADYTYANSFLNAFAEVRETWRLQGERQGKTRAINWPLWEEGGMQVDKENALRLIRATGMTPLSTAKGLKAFEKALAAEPIQLFVIEGEKAKINARLGIRAAKTSSKRVPSVSQEIVRGSSVSQEDMQESVEHDLIAICADILKIEPNYLDKDVDFSDYGVDSIMAMEMMNRIERLYRNTIEPNAIGDYPNVESLAAHLLEAGIASARELPAVPHSVETVTAIGAEIPESSTYAPLEFSGKRFFPSSVKSVSDIPHPFVPPHPEKIAIIGIACRFPRSNSVEAFWDNLQNGRNLITEVPRDRWSIAEYYSPDKTASRKTYSKWGGYIEHIDAFDAEYFGISEAAAVVMDPQHRILLELAQELCDRSGYTRDEINQTRTGVFLGAAESAYARGNYDKIPDEYLKLVVVNRIQNMMAARISDFYNITGPAFTIDTACSSSLVAIHQACESIRHGESDMAIAGGIELLITPHLHIWFSKAEVLSDEEKSYIFDERAKGILLGEGAGLVLLKSYVKAVEDGDHILGVISGSAMNNDGHTMGLTVPNLEGQKEVIQKVLAKSNISPESITYLEAHGTGTLLGDPIEIKAATQVYQQYTDEKQYCAVGSVKSNMGHLLHAAGIASFIKVVLAIQNREIPPTLHCERPHPRFKFETSPFYPITKGKRWESRRGIRRSAVSSFGFGGTNCHLIVEEFSDKEAQHYVKKREPLPLTQFTRKKYWLGRDIIPNVPYSHEDSYKEWLVKLRKGEITPEQLLELDHRMEREKRC